MAGKVGVEHAASPDDVFRFLASKPVGIIVCSFDVQSEADRTFLQILKREYPFILVIAACSSATLISSTLIPAPGMRTAAQAASSGATLIPAATIPLVRRKSLRVEPVVP